MIGDPVALTVRRRIERPSAALVARFAGLPTGFVTDATSGAGAMSYRVKPIDPQMSFTGVAVTAFCPAMDNLAVMAALGFVQPGDVIVVGTQGQEAAGIIGDLWATGAKLRGVRALVTDGLVRDMPGLLKVGLPIFAIGHNPNSAFKNGPGTVNLPITCGGVAVAPGDIVVGDRDGVIVVPRLEAEAVAERLEAVKKKEAEMEAIMASAAGKTRSFWSEEQATARGGVRYVD
ncbi:MAG: RraA family protein [Alphaproteobacteria bacterium]|nr:RraA family protein [Alphaproteobacteria bacterium]